VEEPELEALHRHHTGHSWLDLILGISAVLISFISLFLAIHNGRAMERLVEANSWPFVEIYHSNTNLDGTPHMHLDIANKGVGPASIESLELRYDGRVMSDPRALLNAMLNRTTVPSHPRRLTSDVVHTVLAAKEQMTFIDFSPVQDYSAEDYAAIDTGFHKLTVVACYCSVFTECWVVDTSKTRPEKVGSCPGASSG